MSDTTATAAQTPAGEPVNLDAPDDSGSGQTAAGEPHSPEDDAPEGESPNAEAARYRVRLRESEARCDQLVERLTPYLRREVEAAIADVLDVPGDLWEVGNIDLADLYSEDGTLKTNDALGAAAALADQRPRLAKPKPPKAWGQYSAESPGESSWGAVIRP